jgi:hypothetical protein
VYEDWEQASEQTVTIHRALLTGRNGLLMPSKREIAARLPFRIGLDEREAAASLSVSQSFFRQLVDDELMPRPRVARGRRIYCPEELRLAYQSLPREGGDDEPDTWKDFQ